MSNLIDRFHKKVVGNKNKDLDIVPKISSSGDIKKIENIDTILNSWNVILNIPKGTYDHDPIFGSGLYKFVFEPSDIKTMKKIKEEIEGSLTSFDNRAKINNIDVSFLKNMKGFSVTIEAEYNNKRSSMVTTITENSAINILGD